MIVDIGSCKIDMFISREVGDRRAMGGKRPHVTFGNRLARPEFGSTSGTSIQRSLVLFYLYNHLQHSSLRFLFIVREPPRRYLSVMVRPQSTIGRG